MDMIPMVMPTVMVVLIKVAEVEVRPWDIEHTLSCALDYLHDLVPG